eukprot:768504-Hanusia_phi.AAC.7
MILSDASVQVLPGPESPPGESLPSSSESPLPVSYRSTRLYPPPTAHPLSRYPYDTRGVGDAPGAVQSSCLPA